MAIAVSLYSLPFLLITFPLITIPKLDNVFWQTVLILVPVDIFALYLYMKALKLSPLSLSIPFLSFTPVFMILTGFLILDESPNVWGVCGILFVVVGSYVLYSSKIKYGYLAPLRAIRKEPGSWLMLVVAILYSILAVLGKKAIQHSSPIFFGFFFLASVNITILIFFPVLSKIKWNALSKMPVRGICVGFVLYLHVLLHVLAISMVEAVYMISVKRMSIVFAVIYGWLLFKETDIKSRMLGAVLMFLGIGVITLLG